MKTRLTQKDLWFGIYVGKKGSLNEGINIWFSGRFVWPMKRNKSKQKRDESQNLFDQNDKATNGG